MLFLFIGRQFPDKAIDLIDEACATTRMQINNQRKANTAMMDIDNFVGPDHVAQVGILYGYSMHSLYYFDAISLSYFSTIISRL